MRVLITFLSLVTSLSSFANISYEYPLAEVSQQQQFQRLLKELRCLVCQNQDLADSNATLAKDLKSIVYQKVKLNESDEAIKSYLTKRYGDFILFKPPIKQSTWLLWFGPFAMLALGLLMLIRFVKRMQLND